MLHPSRTCHNLGTPVPEMRVITPIKLDELKKAVTQFVTALADGRGRWDDHLAVGEHLAHQKLTGRRILDAFSETALKRGKRKP